MLGPSSCFGGPKLGKGWMFKMEVWVMLISLLAMSKVTWICSDMFQDVSDLSVRLLMCSGLRRLFMIISCLRAEC